MIKLNEEDWPIVTDNHKALLDEGFRLASEIYILLDAVTKKLKSEITGP